MNEQNTSNWQAPPPPEKIAATGEPAQMSEAATITGIFFEPGRTFEDLRRKPRFIYATLIIIVLATSFSFLLANKVVDILFYGLLASESVVPA